MGGTNTNDKKNSPPLFSLKEGKVVLFLKAYFNLDLLWRIIRNSCNMHA